MTKATSQQGTKQLETLSEERRLDVLDDLLALYKDDAFQKQLRDAWTSANGDTSKQERARRSLCWRFYRPVLKQHGLLSSCVDLLQSQACTAGDNVSLSERDIGQSLCWYLDPDLQASEREPLRLMRRTGQSQPMSAVKSLQGVPAARGSKAASTPSIAVRFIAALSGEVLTEKQVPLTHRVREMKNYLSRDSSVRLLLGERLLHDVQVLGDLLDDVFQTSPRPAELDVFVIRLDPDRTQLLGALELGLVQLQELGEELRDDPEAVLTASLRNVDALRHASARLRSDQDFISILLKERVGALQHLSSELRNQSSLVLRAVASNPSEALRFAGQHLKSDPKVVLAAVEKDGLSLQHASWEMQADENVVLAAVKSTGAALQYADVTVIGNSKVVAAAIRQDRDAIRFAAEDLRSDPAFWPTMEEVGLFEDPEMEELLWISPMQAAELDTGRRVVFADARFAPAFELSHVASAHNLPGGRSTHELGDVGQTQVFSLLTKDPRLTLVVYSDDGSPLASCSYLARRFRMHPAIRAHRVLRLRGGLKLWTQSGLPVAAGR